MPDVAVLDISDIRQLLINGPWKWNDLGSWINPGKYILFSDHIYYINKFSSKYFVNMNRWYWLSYNILFEITQKKIFPKMMWYNCIHQKRRIQKYCSFFYQVTETENSYRMEMEGLPPESEKPKRSHHRSKHRQTCASKELYGERRNLH